MPALYLLLACSGGAAPPEAPIPPGALVAPCPETPNCVSTAAPPEDAEHHAAPLTYTGAREDAQARMKALVLAMPRTRLVEEAPGSLRFTFTSLLFRFVDDVHIVLADGRVEYRSASRVGTRDFGVNRARMEAIAASWASGGAGAAP